VGIAHGSSVNAISTLKGLPRHGECDPFRVEPVALAFPGGVATGY